LTKRPAIIALLGRRDSPTDAVEDYCQCLAAALGKKGVLVELARVPWAERGWLASLRWLWRQSLAWNGQWVLAQYTALAWSHRGLALGFLPTIWLLKRTGAKVAIVFHDPLPFPGKRLRDRLRALVQRWVMRCAARSARRIISPLPAERVFWMQDPLIGTKLVVIPIGSNIPERWREPSGSDSRVLTVAVFAVTERNQPEATQVARVVKKASERVGPLRLIVMGRGAPEAEPFLRQTLSGSMVRLEIHGIIPCEEVSALLSEAHVQLFVRSGIAARRGSVVAGIVCGLPVVGWADEETAFPVTEAGVRAVPVGDEHGLIRELVAVLTDTTFRSELAERSRRAAQQHFAWESVAGRFLAALDLPSETGIQEAVDGPI